MLTPEAGRGESHMKQMGMFVVSLRGVNFGILVSLRVFRAKRQYFMCACIGYDDSVFTSLKPAHYMSYLCIFKRSLFGVKVCLSHAQIGLFKGSQKAWATPRWSPLGVKFKISDGGVPPPPRSYKFKKCAFSQIKVETFVEMVRANLQNLARKHLEITSAILVTAQGRLIICTEETSI